MKVTTPSTRRNSFVGFFKDATSQNLNCIEQSRAFGPVYKGDVLGFPVTVVTDIETIHEVYKNTAVFQSKGAFPPTLTILFGKEALFVLDGEKHREKRGTIQQAFSPALFPLYFEPIIQSAYKFWDNVSGELAGKESITLSGMIKDHYLRVIVSVTTGQKVGGSNGDFLQVRQRFVTLAKGLFSLIITPTMAKAKRAQWELVKSYKNEMRRRLKEDGDVIDSLREAGDKLALVARRMMKSGKLDILTVAIAFSPLKTGDGNHDERVLQELAELLLLMWFAGYTTQSSGTLGCIMEMEVDGRIRERLRKEQEEIMERHGSSEITIEQVMKEMPLLDSYIYEILRVRPPVPVIFRKAIADTSLLGHEIRRGDVIGLDAWGAQRNEKYFEDGNKIVMDRFEGGDTSKVLAFGSSKGPHYCVGAALAKVSMKVTLCVLLREYDIELDEQDMGYMSIPENQPREGVRLRKCTRRS